MGKIESGTATEIVLSDCGTANDHVLEVLTTVFSLETPRAKKLISDAEDFGASTVGWYPAPVAEALLAEARRVSESTLASIHLNCAPHGPLARCSFCHRPASEVKIVKRSRAAAICETCLASGADSIRASVATERFRYVKDLLNAHFFGVSADDIATSFREFPSHLRVDMYLAAERSLAPLASRFVGIGDNSYYDKIVYASLLESDRMPRSIVPVQYEEIDIGDAQPIRCPSNGLWLLGEGELRAAALIAQNMDYRGGCSVRIEFACPKGDAGEKFISRQFKAITDAVAEARSYRGKVLSLETPDPYSGKSSGVTVHKLPAVARRDLVLPARTLRLLERNVLGFSKTREHLKRLGLSTRIGILLYGPPGTGKTHTIRYLAGELQGHTTLLIAAEQAGLIEEYFRLARLLQPTLMVIEDADLIARTRTQMGSACEEVLLNKLLNEMDGLKEDADIFFILTSNRPEQLEGALAGRPGRIDQAIEVPMPDASGRAKLVKLYAKGLTIEKSLAKAIVSRTHGVSAAFIKELMRRLAQKTQETEKEVDASAVDEALNDMLFDGGRLNASLLGVSETHAAMV